MGKQLLSVFGRQFSLGFEINSCNLLISTGYDTQLPCGWTIGSYDDTCGIYGSGTELGQ